MRKHLRFSAKDLLSSILIVGGLASASWAGNVTTVVQSRVLTLSGSSDGDTLTVSRLLGLVRVVASSGTTINGRSSAVFFRVDSVVINGNAGDDQVTFSSVPQVPAFAAVTFHGGADNDTLLGELLVSQGLTVQTDDGNDTVELDVTSSVQFNGEDAPAGPKPAINVSTGNGADLVKFIVAASDKFSTVLIDLGAGADSVFGDVPDGDVSCTVNCGPDSDSTNVNGPTNSLSILSATSTVDLGEGDNDVRIQYVSSQGVHMLLSGAGQDSVAILGVGNLDADFGDGDDNVTFDLLEGSLGVTTVDLGDGDDSLFLPVTTSTNDLFDGGPGFDTAVIDPLGQIDGSDFVNFEDINGPTSRRPASRLARRR